MKQTTEKPFPPKTYNRIDAFMKSRNFENPNQFWLYINDILLEKGYPPPSRRTIYNLVRDPSIYPDKTTIEALREAFPLVTPSEIFEFK